MTSRIAGPLRGLPHPLARLDGSLELVRQFTPSWFTAAMGTGILALALNQPPFWLPGAQAIARGLWPFDIVLFVLFAALYLARWVLSSRARGGSSVIR